MCRCRGRSRLSLHICVGLLALGATADASALVASCADGSVVIAKKWEDVRCRGAMALSSGAPTPLGSDARQQTQLRRDWLGRVEAAREREVEAQIGAAVQRALSRLIDRSSDLATPAIERPGDAWPPLRMRLAHSQAIEAKLRAAVGALGVCAGHPVVAFWLEPTAADLTGGPPAFAQGGSTFRPDPTDPRQLGWLDPEPREVAGRRLGYVVLPADFDLERPIVLFWDDAVAAAWFRPPR